MLNIAVVASNFELACESMKVLAESDISSNIKYIKPSHILMEDGTMYMAVSKIDDIRDPRIDQMIIINDNSDNVYSEQFETIDYVYRILNSISEIPIGFRIQEYKTK